MKKGYHFVFLALSFLVLSSLVGAMIPAKTSTVAAATAEPAKGMLILPVRGVLSPFERRGYPSGYYDGELIKTFNDFDPVVGTTVAAEVALQLDAMLSMGINTITISLSTADATPGAYVTPDCTVNPALGLLWPQPTATELTNLEDFFDLVHSKGIKIYLTLSNTHMQEQPPTNSETWLGSILNVVKDHPALDLVLFYGDREAYDFDLDGTVETCGGRAEPPLWEGPGSLPADYVKWAINYAHTIGVPYRKLSAAAIVGDYFTFSQTPNPYMIDGHFWDSVVVLKDIFDDLGIPAAERTYAISFYERFKCVTADGIPCVDANPHDWAVETVHNLFDVIGTGTGARVVTAEMGYLTPEDTRWSPDLALESLMWIMQYYGIDGGCFWLWANFYNGDELNPAYTTPIKQRGIAFNYNPIKNVLEHLYEVGQSDDLSLVPEIIAPVFGSVSVSTPIVQNGDEILLSANLGESHLFVSADLNSWIRAKSCRWY